MKIEMDFKEFLDKYVYRISYPLTESAKKREEEYMTALIEEDLKKDPTKKIIVATSCQSETDSINKFKNKAGLL